MVLLLHHATGLTHEALAVLCGLTQSTITRALAGRGLTRPDVVTRVLTALGAPDVSRAPSFGSRPRSASTSWEQRLGQDATTTLEQVRALVNRAAPEEVVELLEADVRRLCSAYVHTPLTELYPHIIERRRAALDLASTLTHPEQSRRAHIAATRLVGLQTHASMDTGAYSHAFTHATAAQVLADRVADPGLKAWVCALHSLIAYWDSRPEDALRAAEAGLVHSVTDSNLARLHALRARAAAAFGDRNTTRDAIAAAEDHNGQTVLPGVLGFPQAKTHTYAGTALLALGSPAERRLAISHTERAIALYTGPTRSTGDLLAARLDLATAHLRDHDPDGALEQIDLVCASPPEQRTASIAQRVRGLIPLAQGLQTPLALRIRDRLFAFDPTPTAHRSPTVR
ncbi:helix-turn-helix domain-containing protein [Nocardiopsis alba]|uniref:helix-turn-helix domain-containing protein n=1 Tax=Nocardiopsis alba TaxID=53437 RepID=UPI001651AAF5|nr:helix-turn-helix transcriptional regulator [Nocardiopsis alba]